MIRLWKVATIVVLALAIFAGTVVVSQPRSDTETDFAVLRDLMVEARESGDLEQWRTAVETVLLRTAELSFDNGRGLVFLSDTLLELDTTAGRLIWGLEARVEELERQLSELR